ncbi:hypothetical protein EJ071_38045 [Mesorhizobium sp. M1B.F.Ca.ET.045.04.1.1]|nr:hypothetical protein EJ071_38045 [Mesorhizobium sp. M1B.F.Ca.ET.045.04.1.1]
MRHHIIPGNSLRVLRRHPLSYRAILSKFGIGLNSVENGIGLTNHFGPHTTQPNISAVRRKMRGAGKPGNLAAPQLPGATPDIQKNSVDKCRMKIHRHIAQIDSEYR